MIASAALAVAVPLLALQPAIAVADGETPAEVAVRNLYPEIETSSEIKGKALADGEITDPSGEPVEDVVVTLEAWPSGEEVNEIAIGEVVPVSIVAKALTDENGQFELKMDNSTLLDEYAEDGSVDFQIVTHTTDGKQAIAFTGDIEKSGNNVVLGESTLDGPITMEIDEPAPVEDLLAEEAALKPKVCSWIKVADYPKQDALIAVVYSTAANVKTAFTYKSGQSTELGVGVNVGTSTTTFKSSGSSKTATTATVSYNDKTGAHRTGYYKSARYYKAQLQCQAITSHGVPVPTKYNDFRVMPSGLSGGWSANLTGSVPTTKSSNCDWYEKSVAIDNGSSVVWSNGVSFKSKIGADLTSHIRYASDLKINFTKTSGKGFNACGTVSWPESNNPGVLVARP